MLSHFHCCYCYRHNKPLIYRHILQVWGATCLYSVWQQQYSCYASNIQMPALACPNIHNLSTAIQILVSKNRPQKMQLKWLVTYHLSINNWIQWHPLSCQNINNTRPTIDRFKYDPQTLFLMILQKTEISMSDH